MVTSNSAWPFPANSSGFTVPMSVFTPEETKWLAGIRNTIAESRALRERLEARLPQKPFDPLGLLPPAPNAPIDITRQGHWPVNAMFAIEIETFHRDFGNLSGGKNVRFFETEEQMKQDLVEEATHIANIDWAYSAHIQVYEWDLGPNHKRTEYL